MSSQIGERLKALRTMYGYSQREVAKRSGVTNSTISLIEQGRVSPSVESLRKVLSSFSLSLVDFLTMNMEMDKDGNIFFNKDDLIEFFDLGAHLKLVGANRKNRKLRFLHERYEIGAYSGDTMLSHEGEEAGYVVSGELELTVGRHSRVLKAGDSYYFNTIIPHRFRNVGNDECIVISAATPPSF